MDNLKLGILSIIKSALTGEKQDLPEDFDLTEAVEVAKKHSIIPIFYYGALNCGIDSSNPLMQQLFMSTCQIIAMSERQMFFLNEIFDNFDKSGIEYMALKGTLLKKMYPKPEMRTMGDADILIKIAQYDKIKPIMESLNYTEKVESDHELSWIKKGSFIELHKRLIPSYNKDYFAYFGDGWQLATIKNGTSYTMSDEDQMIYLFTHYAKHYRDAGIGIKHIVDLWVYRKNTPDLDEEYIKAELEKLQLSEFYKNTIHTLEVWFENIKADETTDFITQIIFGSGTFGTHEAHLLSKAVKIAKSHSGNNLKKYQYLNLLFLPYPSMCLKYPFLKKLPFLLPFMWIYRIFEALIFKKDKIKKHNKNVNSITQEGVSTYQDSLNFVGLDFNFKE